jgi:SAM-dependent methyltransferase
VIHPVKTQEKQSEWHEQWSLLEDNELFLFQDWIQPFRLEDFRGKKVLEFGCGGGQHTAFVAPYAAEILAVDLNTSDLARKRVAGLPNVRIREGDIGNLALPERFDAVFSVGVLHHTDDPDRSFANLMRHAAPGGTVIVWVYSKEGNALVEYGVEPFRKLFLRRLARRHVLTLSRLICALMYVPIYTLYRLPLRWLPFFEYFQNFRRLSFYRNTLNVFDKLNAPQVQFISRERIERWFDPKLFAEVTIRPYKGVSWTGVGVLKKPSSSGRG